MTISTKLEISDSGKIVKIFHENGRLIAEVLVKGPLLQAALNCHDNVPIVTGRPNVYRAECFGLAGWEYLNCETEQIEEK